MFNEILINYKSTLNEETICRAANYPYKKLELWKFRIKESVAKGYKAEILTRKNKLEKEVAKEIQNKSHTMIDKALLELKNQIGLDFSKEIDTIETYKILIKKHGEFKVKRRLFGAELIKIVTELEKTKELKICFFEFLALKGISEKDFYDLFYSLKHNYEIEYYETLEEIEKKFKQKLEQDENKDFEKTVQELVSFNHVFKNTEQDFELYHLHIFPEIFIIYATLSQMQNLMIRQKKYKKN